MQPPGRDGRGGNGMRGGGGGGGAFPGFPDFPGFGGRPGFLSDMFDSDPFFSDPFFTRPFGSLFGNTGNLFGPSGFFSQGLFPPHAGHHQGLNQGSGFRRQVPIEHRPINSAPEGGRRGVHIEELPDDHEDGGNAGPTSNQEPIIEHPEDDENNNTGNDVREITRYQPDPPASQSWNSNSAFNSRSTNIPVTYSYQSSSVTYGGANGPYYAAHSSRRVGPYGVYEEEHQEQNTASGKESHKILHGLGHKGRALTRKRNAEGREEQFETLHNLAQDEVQDFERTWETRAEKSLPGYKSSSQRLGSGSGTKSRAALPSSGGSSSGSKTRVGPPSNGVASRSKAGGPSSNGGASRSKGGGPSNGGAPRSKGR